MPILFCKLILKISSNQSSFLTCHLMSFRWLSWTVLHCTDNWWPWGKIHTELLEGRRMRLGVIICCFWCGCQKKKKKTPTSCPSPGARSPHLCGLREQPAIPALGLESLEQEESSEEEARERHRLGDAEHIQKYPKVLLGFAVSKHSWWDKPSDFPEVDSTHHACTAGHVQSHSPYLDPQAGMNNPAPELPHLIFHRTTG